MKTLPIKSAAAALVAIAALSAQPLGAWQGIFAKGDNKKLIDAALAQPYKRSYYAWVAGGPPKLMDPVATHVCLLSEVRGNFAGAGERVTIEADSGSAGGSRWLLTGTSGNPNLRAGAICVPKQTFSTGMLDPVKVRQWRIAARESTGCQATSYDSKLPGTEYTGFIRTMAGKWRGGGESLTAVRGSGDSLRLTGCSGYVGGALLVMRMEGAGSLKYATVNGRTSTASSATMVNSIVPGSSKTGSSYKELIPVAAGVCGLVSVSGKLAGNGEAVEIVEVPRAGGPWWALKISSLASDEGISASVRCIARDQR